VFTPKLDKLYTKYTEEIPVTLKFIKDQFATTLDDTLKEIFSHINNRIILETDRLGEKVKSDLATLKNQCNAKKREL